MKYITRIAICGLYLLTHSAGAHPLTPPSVQAFAAGNEPLISGVEGVGITVKDLDTSLRFYQTVLGCEFVSQREEAGDAIEHLTGVFGVRTRTAVLHLGSEVIELTDYLAPEGKVIPQDAQSNDQAFQHIAIVVRNMDTAYEVLRQHNVQHISPGPQTLPSWNTNAGGIKAFYFRDPDGHSLELIWFPEGKGDPKWQAIAKSKTEGLFLGIDHTAIVVSSTDQSLAFYRDTLGMKVVGASENYGVEQERLNNVFGAHLRITALRAERGIGVEFLEYLSPATGRDAALYSASNDLWHYHTILTTHSLEAITKAIDLQNAQSITQSKPQWISSIAVDPDGVGVQPMQRMARDGDRHCILIRETPASPTSADATQDRK